MQVWTSLAYERVIPQGFNQMTGLDRLARGTVLKNIFPRGDIWVLIL